jgi:hypothetical protein
MGDSNDFWTNNKYRNDLNYNTSLQPALVYEATITPDSPKTEYLLNPFGHSYPSGETGELFTDLTTIIRQKRFLALVFNQSAVKYSFKKISRFM